LSVAEKATLFLVDQKLPILYNNGIVINKEPKMSKAKKVELIDDLPKMRSLDVNELFEYLDEADCPIDCINERLILDGAFGNQSSCEGILENAKFYDISNDEYQACEAGVEGAMRAVNDLFNRMNMGFEIVEVDLCENIAYMMIAKGATPKQVAKSIIKGKI
jgi:hypothetical protein